MRKIDEIILHCSATKEDHNFKAKDINTWHKQRGFKYIGYHYVIDIDGTIEKGRPEDEIGAHCLGHNERAIGICYIGGLDTTGKSKDTRTSKQKESLIKLVANLKLKYTNATVHGHNEFSNKACPCFNVQNEFI